MVDISEKTSSYKTNIFEGNNGSKKNCYIFSPSEFLKDSTKVTLHDNKFNLQEHLEKLQFELDWYLSHKYVELNKSSWVRNPF